MFRFDIINKIISNNRFSKYLEIGVRNPDDCFNKINCENKDSVDPNIEFKDAVVDYNLTSDKFFSELEKGKLDKEPDHKWDVVFIDGLHLSYQVKNDIENSLNHLSENGYIVLHDCNPPDWFHAREDYLVNGQLFNWNGTVWKALYYFRANRPDLNICAVDTDWGCGLITKMKSGYKRPKVPFNNEFFEYNKMIANRELNLGLIPKGKLKSWLKYNTIV